MTFTPNRLLKLPPLMRELCLLVNYFPQSDCPTSRYNLTLRIGALPEEDWEKHLGAEARGWYNRAAKAIEESNPIPGFLPETEAVEVRRKEGDTVIAIMIRSLIHNSGGTYMDFTDTCLASGAKWSNEAFPRVQKAQFKAVLKVLDEEGCLSKKGKKVLGGKLLQGEDKE